MTTLLGSWSSSTASITSEIEGFFAFLLSFSRLVLSIGLFIRHYSSGTADQMAGLGLFLALLASALNFKGLNASKRDIVTTQLVSIIFGLSLYPAASICHIHGAST